MEARTRQRVVRVSVASLAVALAAATIASSAPSLDFSLRAQSDDQRVIRTATPAP